MNRRSVSSSLPLPGAAIAGCCCLLVLASLASGSSASESTTLPEKVASSIRSLSREKSKAIVRIRCTDGHGEVNGTGFYIDPSGMVCTLGEIVHEGDRISIQQDGEWHPASIVAIDSRSGVAFLKSQSTNVASGAAAFLNPGNITNVPAQTPVVGMGFPRDAEATPSLGMITGTQTHSADHFFCVPHLVASVPLSDGEGGCPVMDLSGGLVGMVVSGDSRTGSCLILPAAAIQKLHHDLLYYGRLKPGWIGAAIEEAAVPQGNSRTRVAAIQQGSPAESAGILQGDMILSISGHLVTDPEEVPAISFYLTGGEPVEITLMRDGELKKIKVRCGEPTVTIGSLGNHDAAQPEADAAIK